jgi:hypothetical protein
MNNKFSEKLKVLFFNKLIKYTVKKEDASIFDKFIKK